MQSKLLNTVSGLKYGVTTRMMGDMRQEKNRKLVQKNLFLPQQVHGNNIQTDIKKPSGADGIVSQQQGVFVGVLVADCVPLLMVNAKTHMVAAVHAGWRGTHGHIAANAITIIGKDIRVFIGPHIGPCCYTVSEDRVQLFDPSFSYYRDGLWHLDIGLANKKQLIDAGVHEDNIELSSVCTSCQSDIFYSYRKDTKESFGEMLAYIGFIL